MVGSIYFIVISLYILQNLFFSLFSDTLWKYMPKNMLAQMA